MRSPGRSRLPRHERRALIVQAARDEFVDVGLSGARTRSIAERAGVAEALLYQHFDSKDDLFRAAVVDPLDHVMDVLADLDPAVPGDAATYRDNTRRYVVAVLEAMRESFALLGVVLFEDRHDGETFYRGRMADLLDASIAAVRDNLEGWSHRHFDPEFSVPATFGMCWFLAVDAAYRGRDLDVEGLADQVVAMIFDGLARPAT
ncbi:MAG: TetR/AcrR family transcriptional regulator [Desertimonas sp.]